MNNVFTFQEVLNLIKKHKIFIFLFTGFFTIIVTGYTLLLPNNYYVYIKLNPTKNTGNSMGLSLLQSMTGLNLNKNDSIGLPPDVAFQNLLSNYIFMKNFILKYNYDKRLKNKTNWIYLSPKLKKLAIDLHLFKNKNFNKNNNKNFYSKVYIPFIKNFIINTDKKGFITIGYKLPDRKLAYEIVENFLKDGTKYLSEYESKNLENKILNYQKEIINTNNIELKQVIGNLIANLIKQKVLINTNKYYKSEVLLPAFIPPVDDKIGPYRSIIVITSFLLSLLLSIFILILKEGIKEEKLK